MYFPPFIKSIRAKKNKKERKKENPKDATRKLLDEYSKVAEDKINTQKSLAFIWKMKNQNQIQIKNQKIKEIIPFTIETKRIKYLGINLPEETKDLYTENYKTLMKETKDDTDRWRNIPCSWIGTITIVKMSVLPKQSIDSMPSLSNYQQYFSKN